MKIFRAVIFSLLLTASAARAEEPITVWDTFLTALRHGQMREAYACFTPTARGNYRDFCVAWHPLSRNYQAVLSPPLFSEFCIAGDIAYLRLGVRDLKNADFMYAYLVREDEQWWLVSLDPQIAVNVLIEADGRNFLRQLWACSPLARQCLMNGASITLAQLKGENPRLFAQMNTRRVFTNYHIEIDNLRAGVLRLRPKKANLRGWEFTADQRIIARTDLTPFNNNNSEPLQLAEPPKIPSPNEATNNLAATKIVAPAPTAKIEKTVEPAYSISLPETPPDFGNPDLATTPVISAHNNNETMPELDEMMMTAPAIGVPKTDFKLPKNVTETIDEFE